VDDSAFARNTLRAIVQTAGHEVVGCAENADQAIDLFKSLQPELVLLDYLMPGRSGEDVLKEIIRDDPAAKVIMISGSGDLTIQKNAVKHGAKVFLRKPFRYEQILETICDVMRGSLSGNSARQVAEPSEAR